MEKMSLKPIHKTSRDAEFFRYRDKDIFVGDVLDSAISPHMSAGYYRNFKKGESNDWVVSYDEVLIVTKGRLIIRTSAGDASAGPGEIVYLRKGTSLSYEAGTDDTEAVYVTYPHWLEAAQASEHADMLNAYDAA